jgi:hypothetical protein
MQTGSAAVTFHEGKKRSALARMCGMEADEGVPATGQGRNASAIRRIPLFSNDFPYFRVSVACHAGP